MNCITTIDWAATGTMLQGIGTIIGGIAVIVAAFIGSNTFKSWRQQKLSERRIDQAERILTATYKARQGLLFVRNPAIWAHEIFNAEEHLKANGEWDKVNGQKEQRDLSTAQAYYNRINRTKDDRRVLQECQPMARALFGEDLEKALEKLNHQFWVVEVHVDSKLHDKGELDTQFREKINRTLWSGYPSPEKNEVDQIIDAQVKLIEEVCVPVLRLEKEQ